MHWAHMSEDNTMIGQQAPENCLFLSLKNVVTSTYHHVQIFFFNMGSEDQTKVSVLARQAVY